MKNSTTSFLGLALLVVFCLVGLPRVASAQSAGTPLSDVTLEQFMSALEARYSNAVYYNTAATGLGTDVDVFRFPVVGLSANGPMVVYATVPIGPYGQSLYYPLAASSDTLTNILDFLVSSSLSNTLERVYNFMGSTYDVASGYDVQSMYTQLELLSSTIESYLRDSYVSAPGGASGSPGALQVVDLGTPYWLDAHSGFLGDDPMGPVLFVQDPLAAEKLDELIEGQNDLADVFAEGMPIAEDSLYQMGEEFRLALDDALGGPFSGTIVPESANALTNMVSSERDIMDTEGLMFTNAVYSVTGNVNQLLGAVDVGALSNDFRSLLGAFLPNSGRSTVLQLTPSLDISTRPGSPALSLAPIEVDLADSRFTVGGWPLWQVLRALCILGWWAWWFWFMYGFLHKWISKFASLMGS